MRSSGIPFLLGYVSANVGACFWPTQKRRKNGRTPNKQYNLLFLLLSSLLLFLQQFSNYDDEYSYYYCSTMMMIVLITLIIPITLSVSSGNVWAGRCFKIRLAKRPFALRTWTTIRKNWQSLRTMPRIVSSHVVVNGICLYVEVRTCFQCDYTPTWLPLWIAPMSPEPKTPVISFPGCSTTWV